MKLSVYRVTLMYHLPDESIRLELQVIAINEPSAVQKAYRMQPESMVQYEGMFEVKRERSL